MFLEIYSSKALTIKLLIFSILIAAIHAVPAPAAVALVQERLVSTRL